MQKKVMVPVSIAAVGFIAGGIMLGSLGAAAHGSNGFHKGDRGEVVAEVLGVDRAGPPGSPCPTRGPDLERRALRWPGSG